MQVTLRGWSRDHGAKTLIAYDDVYIAYGRAGDGTGSYEWKKTYVDVIKTERRRLHGHTTIDCKVRITGSAELNSNGGYMVQVELDEADIDRLFYLTHGVEEGKRTIKALEEAVRTLRGLYGDANDSAA